MNINIYADIQHISTELIGFNIHNSRKPGLAFAKAALGHYEYLLLDVSPNLYVFYQPATK